MAAAAPAGAQAPRVTGFTPDSGAPGTLVKIVGERLDRVTAVFFHGAESPSVRFVSPEHLKAVVPEGATTGPIGVEDLAGTLSYSARAFSIVGPSSFHPPLALAPPRPSPTSGDVEIAFSLSAAGPVSLVIFDLRGVRVRTLVDGDLPAGPHQRPWNGRDDLGRLLGNGIYFIRLAAQRESLIRRLAVIR